MTLREILKSLPDEKRKALMGAFNECKTLVIDYAERKFIAVNLTNPPANYRITETVGVWCLGTFVEV